MKKNGFLGLCLALCLLIGGTAVADGYTAGTYSATVPGASGDVVVETTVDDQGKILDVQVTKQSETTSDISKVLKDIPAAIVDAQSTEVEAVSGSTITTKAICKAVDMGLAQARGEEIAAETAAEDAGIQEKAEIEIPAASAPVSTDKGADYADTIAWNMTYDVVVAGYGAAGATSAISASDAGASVLLLEKAPKGSEGGNSKFAGQDVMGPTTYEGGLAYYKALRGLFTEACSDSMLETYVAECVKNPDYLVSLGAVREEFWDKPWPEYPEFEGADTIHTWIVGGQSFQGTLYKLLQENVAKRDIDVLYEARATHLIQDPYTKTILGVQFEKDGQTVNVRATNGVVLATGGFEANQEMIQNYLQQPYVYVVAAVYNTGDGIKMAQEVGADLWHMSNSAGYTWGFQPEGQPTAIRSLTVTNGIIVGPEGKRFMDETTTVRHGKINYGGRWISMPTPLPAYFICDAAGLAAGPISKNWSEGNQEEVEKGWIVKGDTVEELAEKIGVDPANLQATLDKYNGFVANGEDMQFGRDPEKLVAVKDGPFYALEIGPCMLNTQGGAKRNEKAEVLDVNGNPIPHLYSAGEMGALFADMYNGGGNLGECVSFGRIAGANAAAAK